MKMSTNYIKNKGKLRSFTYPNGELECTFLLIRSEREVPCIVSLIALFAQ